MIEDPLEQKGKANKPHTAEFTPTLQGVVQDSGGTRSVHGAVQGARRWKIKAPDGVEDYAHTLKPLVKRSLLTL